MANNSSLSLQKNIKDNSEELQDFIKDLKNWETDIKAVDKSLSKESKGEGTASGSETIPPVRCKKKLETTSKSSTPPSCEGKRRKNDTDNKEKISAYDYAAWDKFDVDKAIASSEEEDNVGADIEPVVEKKKSAASRGPKASKKERAVALKDEGNKLYSSGRLDDAIAKYTQGMALDPTNALLPANRAMAYIKIQQFKAAEGDCNRCLKLDSGYVKGYLRRATVRMNLDKLDLALKDYQKVLELEPWNKEAKKELVKHNIPIDTSNIEIIQKPDSKTSVEKQNKLIAKATVKSSESTKTEPVVAQKNAKQVQISNKDDNSKRINDTCSQKCDAIKNVDQNCKNVKGDQKNEKASDVKKKINTDKINDKGNEVKKPGKKLKIIEVNSQEEERQKQAVSADPSIVLPIDKPPHLRSTKPLQRIPVIDVSTKEDIRKVSTVTPAATDNKPQDIKATHTKPPQPKQTKRPSKVDLPLPLLKKTSVKASTVVPRTSHQFNQEWSRVSKDKTQAAQYMKIIPPSFFSGVELEADSLVEVVSCLREESVPPSTAAQCLLALSRSTGFSVTVMFLDQQQKNVLLDVITKCESETELISQLESLKASLV